MKINRRISLVFLGAGMAALVVYAWAHGWMSVGQASSIATMSMMLTGTTWMLGAGIVQFVDEAGYITDALTSPQNRTASRDKPNAAPLKVGQGHVPFR